MGRQYLVEGLALQSENDRSLVTDFVLVLGILQGFRRNSDGSERWSTEVDICRELEKTVDHNEYMKFSERYIWVSGSALLSIDSRL